MRELFFAAMLLGASASAIAAPTTLTLDQSTLSQLGSLDVGATLVLDEFPDGFGGHARVTFKRIDVYAPDARIVVVDKDGEHALPRSTRIGLIGASDGGDVRASLSFDAHVRNVSGTGSSPSGAFAISAEHDAGALRLRSRPLDDTLPAGVKPQIVESDDALPTGRPQPSALEISLAGAAPTGAVRSAVVAVDTDNEFMSLRFGNDMSAATNWIADLFVSMNVMYQRDLGVALLQGTTYLRTAADPYSQSATPADENDLNEFGAYWQAHLAAVPRSFAMLLSGKAEDGNHASGIAWINSYCQTAGHGGSYSVSQVFTNHNVNVSYSALIVGHELGHNFGAFHTHCTNASTGGAPTGTNTIDRCASGESYLSGACYSGPTSCPTSGPGAPAGTIMSYCNTRSCGPEGQNVPQFHPTQIGVLNALIGQNTPSCLAVGADHIFGGGFE